MLSITGAAAAADVHVMTSAGFYQAYSELVPAFERSSGHRHPPKQRRQSRRPDSHRSQGGSQGCGTARFAALAPAIFPNTAPFVSPVPPG